MINILKPFNSIGSFFLGDEIKKYLQKYNFRQTPVDLSTGWETYSIDDEGIALFTENDIIVSILCEKVCIFNDKNIIGMNFNKFIKSYNLSFNEEGELLDIDDYEQQKVYDIEEIGLQVWCDNNNNILTIIASKNFED